MKKPGRPHPESDRQVLCPFCETPVDRAAADRLCLGCGTAWTPGGSGEAIFDSSHRADRAMVDSAARRERARRASSGGLTGGERRRPVRLGKKGPRGER